MENIKFIIGGKTGDLLHCLYSVRGLCEKFGVKADLYITNDRKYGGDEFHFEINRTFEDLKPLIIRQEYISSFNILKDDIAGSFVNLNNWRKSPGLFKTNWINILCLLHQIPISDKNWISYEKDDYFKDKIVIHRSTRRFSKNFPWESIVKKNDCIFITSDIREYDMFPYKNHVKVHEWRSFSDLSKIINSSKFFIGNMSTPLALAHGLGVPRLAELYVVDQIHYIGEENVLKDYFYFSDNMKSHISGLDKFIHI
jgi:hypothetical protein